MRGVWGTGPVLAEPLIWNGCPFTVFPPPFSQCAVTVKLADNRYGTVVKLPSPVCRQACVRPKLPELATLKSEDLYAGFAGVPFAPKLGRLLFPTGLDAFSVQATASASTATAGIRRLAFIRLPPRV